MKSLFILVFAYVCLCTAQPSPPPPPPPPSHHNPIEILLGGERHNVDNKTRPPPPFLANCSEAAVKNFLDAVKNCLVIDEAVVRGWTSQCPQAKVAVEGMKKSQEECLQKIKSGLATATLLSAPEKEAIQKILDIRVKTNLTIQQQFEQADSIFNALPEKQKKNIGQFLHSLVPHPPPPQ